MYSFLNGNLVAITSKYIVLDINNIGYEIKVPNPFNYKINEITKIYTYLHIREDIMDLYGFMSFEEKVFFINLISVKGIGPKSALAILASGNYNDIAIAIENSDDKYLTKFPGVGPKAAMQIVLDLKGKLVVDEQSSSSANYNDVIEALMALGYKRKEVEKHVLKLAPRLSDSEAIKIVLKQL